MTSNGKITVDTMKEELFGVTVKSKYTGRNVHARDSINPATAGQYVLGVTGPNGSTEYNVVVTASDTEELAEEMLNMVEQEGNAGQVTQEQYAGSNVFVTRATPKVYRVTYQSTISGRQFSIKYSARKADTFIFTATRPNGEPEQRMEVKRNDAILFLETLLAEFDA